MEQYRESSEEYFSEMRSELAEKAGVSVEEFEEMSIRQIESELGISGAPVEYGSSRYDMPSEIDLAERKARVSNFLFGDKSYAERKMFDLGVSFQASVERARENFSGLF